MKKKLLIEGMSCGHCVKHVKEALSELEGVSSVDVDLASKSAILEGEVSEDKIKFAVEDAGYEVVSIENI
ncbi:heavy-metal-associated domain-containing protein [Desnuesiella massiliensis]|uniref:heavy-metal-associated domain-containing protein n=1 Tax=Desnuesiella massiliensis TaxID=1650662 RepID=UPI0006E3EC92|nr:cation transporter [Desnuesiella massiliensis]